MPITSEKMAAVRMHLDKAVAFEHLTRFDWRRQTDCVRQALTVATLFADCGRSAVFVDGHINDHVKIKALHSPKGIKGFFNARFHDLGFKARRVILFDTLTTRTMGKRGSSRDRLHFHAAIELPLGWTRRDLERLLERVFGTAHPMGKRQFHFSSPRLDQHYTHNGVQVSGALGKLAYVMAHAGATYRALELNEDGKRSRRAPASRRLYNLGGMGFARGIPSNFNAAVVFCDSVSKRAGKEAFDAWVAAEQAVRRPLQPITSPVEEANINHPRRASA